MKTNGKMKFTGYLCLVIALALTGAIVFSKVSNEIGYPLMTAWMTLGVTLLFGNAGKRIGGELAQARTQALTHEQTPTPAQDPVREEEFSPDILEDRGR